MSARRGTEKTSIKRLRFIDKAVRVPAKKYYSSRHRASIASAHSAMWKNRAKVYICAKLVDLFVDISRLSDIMYVRHMKILYLSSKSAS